MVLRKWESMSPPSYKKSNSEMSCSFFCFKKSKEVLKYVCLCLDLEMPLGNSIERLLEILREPRIYRKRVKSYSIKRIAFFVALAKFFC